MGTKANSGKFRQKSHRVLMNIIYHHNGEDFWSDVLYLSQDNCKIKDRKVIWYFYMLQI